MSLVETLMQPLRSRYQGGTLDKNVLRRSRYGAWDYFQSQSNNAAGILAADTRASIKRSFGNIVQVPVLDTNEVTIGNVRSCVVQDNENTSKLVTLTFVTYVFGFTMTPAQHYNNDINYQVDFDRKLEKYLLKFATVLDQAAVNTLNINRNQYFPAEITAYYPEVADALQVSHEERLDFYNQMDAILQTMDYYGNVHVLTNPSGMPLINRLGAQGGGNSVNEAFQLNGYEWFTTNRITNGPGIRSTAFIMPPGVVATENRNDPDAIAGSRVGTHKIWSEVDVPIVNLRMGAYYYEDCADKSALHAGTAGLTRTKVEGYEWSTDICFMTPYNPDMEDTYNPIIKVEFANPAVPDPGV